MLSLGIFLFLIYGRLSQFSHLKVARSGVTTPYNFFWPMVFSEEVSENSVSLILAFRKLTWEVDMKKSIFSYQIGDFLTQFHLKSKESFLRHFFMHFVQIFLRLCPFKAIFSNTNKLSTGSSIQNCVEQKICYILWTFQNSQIEFFRKYQEI